MDPVGATEEMPAEVLKELAVVDWDRIAQRRRANFEHLSAAISPLLENGAIRLVHSVLPASTVPLNLPVLIERKDRYSVFQELWSKGIETSALYYRLVRDIDPATYQLSHDVARRILNLPIHQDLVAADLDLIADRLRTVLV